MKFAAGRPGPRLSGLHPRVAAMATSGTSGWVPEFERIAAGEIPSSCEARLRELVDWGGTSSFFSARELLAGAAAGVHPVAQLVGLSAGYLRTGYVRTTRTGQGRRRLGSARWREHSGPVRSWTSLRQRALARLVAQAELLGADAVVGIVPSREAEPRGSELPAAELRFTGTAVRIDGWRARKRPPLLTLASPAEVWAMLRAGVEPAGVAGGFASVETMPGKTTIAALLGRRLSKNVELEDLTEAMYEARRLALDRLHQDAGRLGADGLLGIRLDLEHDEPSRMAVRHLSVTVHVLATAVRRVNRPPASPSAVVALSGRGRG